MHPVHVFMLHYYGIKISIDHFSSILDQVRISLLIFIEFCFFRLAHGTFIGRILLEGHKPQPVHIDSEIHFGESSRLYIIRERPQAHGNKLHHMFGSNANILHSNSDAGGDHNDENKDGNSSFSIPESEIELDVRIEMNVDEKWKFSSFCRI